MAGAVFQWGNKEPQTESSYESMCYNGVWYHLHDCVFCRSGMAKPFVGKLMRLFEDEAGARKVRIRWFFRPYELPVSVTKDFPKNIYNSKELFIALGNVKGVENENVVEVILGKAMVLCTARFGKNMLPLRANIDAADHIFNRAYDAVNRKVVKMVNIPNVHLAFKFTNKLEWLAMEEVEDSKSTTFEEGESSTSIKKFDKVVGKHHSTGTSSIEISISQGKKSKGK